MTKTQAVATPAETHPQMQPMPYWTPAGIVMDEPPPAYVAVIMRHHRAV